MTLKTALSTDPNWNFDAEPQTPVPPNPLALKRASERVIKDAPAEPVSPYAELVCAVSVASLNLELIQKNIIAFRVLFLRDATRAFAMLYVSTLWREPVALWTQDAGFIRISKLIPNMRLAIEQHAQAHLFAGAWTDCDEQHFLDVLGVVRE